MDSISSRIKAAREAMGYTQRDLADVLGISLPSLREYEQSKSIPGGNVVALMAELGWNANWVLIGNGKMFRKVELTFAQMEIVRLFHDFRGGDITCPSIAKARRNFIEAYSELDDHYEEDDFSWLYESHPEITLKELILWDIDLSGFDAPKATIDINDFREATLEVERSMAVHTIELPLWALDAFRN
jgi:transcriptional regulator with XRE-family HTH domain